jgi:hypothetical protein
VDLQRASFTRISAPYRHRDGGGWMAVVNYADGKHEARMTDWGPDIVRVPGTPSEQTRGRVAPMIATEKILFTESFCVTCVEAGR